MKLPILGGEIKQAATVLVILMDFPYKFVHEVWVGVM